MLSTLAVLVNLLLAHGAIAVPAVKEARQAGRCTNDVLRGALPAGAGASVERFSYVSAGGSFVEPLSLNPSYGNGANLPALCAAIIKVTAGDSSYRFGIFLPDAWNSNFIGVGSYAQAGGINWGDMSFAVKYGMATVSTDTGHISKPDNLTWGAGQRPGALDDWGYRAVNGSIHIGKALTKAFYPSKPLAKSYWSGCSTGGRQGLKQIQISPLSLDGVLIGAPAWDTKHLFPWIAKLGTYNITGDGRLLASHVQAIKQAVLTQCDALDDPGKVTDRIISDPENCKPDLTRIQCPAGTSRPNCLTPAQITTATNIYSPYILNGRQVHPGLYPGSEPEWPTFMSPDATRDFDLAYFKHWLYPNDTRFNDYNYFLSNETGVVGDSERLNRGLATADDFNIDAFKRNQGKIIMYHGTADGTVPSRSSREYYTATEAALGGAGQANMDSFFRLFYIPGMGHCSPSALEQFSDAPWMIAGAGQNMWTGPTGYSVPLHERDPNYDALAAVMNWVQNGTAPNKIIATAYRNNAEGRQRPLCPWPKRAVFDTGSGANREKAPGWNCS